MPSIYNEIIAGRRSQGGQGEQMTREYRTYAVTLDQDTRDLLDGLVERLSLPSRSAILRIAVRELAARHGLKAVATARRRKEK